MPNAKLVLLTTSLLLSGCAGGALNLNVTGAGQGLSPITSEKVDELGPSISPDGRTLLFDTRHSRRDATIVGVDPNTGARRTVFTSNTSLSQEAAWDPQNRFFVYTSNSPGSWSLVRAISNSPNAAISIIISGDMAPLISDPDISPDGNRVAFSAFIRGAWNLGVANMDGSNFTLMGEGRGAAWSPDGKRLAFYKFVNDRAHIFTVDVESGTSLTQVTNGESDNAEPSWSPDGRHIVFTSNRTAKKAPSGFSGKKEMVGRFNLFAIRSDGTGLVQLTDGDAQSIQPSWGKDGFIYFATNQSGNYDIWRLRPTGAN